MESSISLRFIKMFTYGLKLKILKKGKTYSVLMMLNPNNNFFLEFVQYKNKLNIISTIFLPHIKSVRSKIEIKQLKLRMGSDLNPIYLICKEDKTLEELENAFNELIKHTKNFPYACYTKNNLMYYALYKLKIYKHKDKVFSERDVQFIFDSLKIRKKKLEDIVKGKSHVVSIPKDGKETSTKQKWTDEMHNVRYCAYIKKKLKKLFQKHSSISNKVVRTIFNFLISKTELYILFKNCLNNDSVLNVSSETMYDSMTFNSLNEILFPENQSIPFEKFLMFLREFQNESLDNEDIEQLSLFFNQLRIESIFQPLTDNDISEITFEEFCSYIFSGFNSAFDPEKQKLYQDLSRRSIQGP